MTHAHPVARRRRGRRALAVATAAASAVALATVSTGSPAAADAPPATFVGLVSGNALVQFQENTPSQFDSLVLINGLAPGEVVMSIDGRPGTGQLLALAVTPSGGATDGRVYWVDPDTGAATPTGTPTFDVEDAALRTTIDINPTVDRLRVVGTDDQNLRLNPNNGALAFTDTDLAYPPLPVGIEPVVSIAYDRNVAASVAGGITTLYGISQNGSLVTIGGINSVPSPNLGQVLEVGALGAVPDDEHVGFDVTAQNNAYVSMTVGGETGLYTVDLTTGVAALVGAIGNGDLPIRDLAVEIQVDDAASQYTSLATPARLVDTRLTSRVGPGGTLVVGVAGTNDIPANATAAVLDVTVTQPDAGGFTTVFPTGNALPTTSTVNVDGPGQTRAAFATVPLGANGSVSVFSERGSQIIVDVVGFYGPAVSAAGRLVPLAPSRILDTRNGTGVAAGGAAKLSANQTVELQVTGRGGVPAIDPANPTNVAAAIVNVTATQTTAPGFFTAFPGGASQPVASTLNASETDETIANLAVVRVGPTGTIQLFSETGGHLIVDVVGYVTGNPNALATPRGLFVPVTPSRLVDTRLGAGAVAADDSIDVQVTGAGGVPAGGVLGLAGTVTVTQSAGSGFVTAHPTGSTRPEASSVNTIRADQTIANGIVLGTGAGGRITLYTSSGAQLIADVVGFYLS
ncbi:MAG TPA: DUF4394 domain-containing protein [Ilumatobacteraceae bacterium]|nr:DUF4394 domain-containing protein [Ilumatobacteraceae bacterium]